MLTADQVINYQDFLTLSKIQWWVKVASLKSGDTFGELALINNDKRNATLKCITDCVFATIDK